MLGQHVNPENGGHAVQAAARDHRLPTASVFLCKAEK